MIAYLNIFAATTLFVIGNFLFKSWALRDKLWLLLLGIALFAIGNAIRAFAIKQTSLSVVIPLVLLVNMVAGLLIAYFYFHEKLSTVQYVGVAFAIVSIILIAFPFSALAK
ncbi:MAG: EamA family transporter [Patescibacteria group bacterium]